MNCIKNIPRFCSTSIQPKPILNRRLLKCLKLQSCGYSSDLNELPELKESDEFWKKVIYNEILYKARKRRKPEVDTYTKPIFMKYLIENDETVKTTVNNENEESSEPVNFPYGIEREFIKEIDEASDVNKVFPQSVYNFTPRDNENTKPLEWGSNVEINIWNIERTERWAPKFDAELQQYDEENVVKFGTSNPNLKPSSVPCGGCGAFLHCNDPSIPGFIPAEMFEGKTKAELISELCQRCHFLKEYHVSLGVNVPPSQYIKILSTIKDKEALVILMIDMLDFPCSIFPGIMDIIGPSKPVVIIGNKVDLLIQETPECLNHFKTALLKELKKHGVSLQNVAHISLISSKTGYGVEELIDQLHLNWGQKGDVYLVGCTNVGKSTLFNTLIQSDYCKVKATNILQRATISAWPGTTLNLLKFPILKLNKSRLYARLMRLKHQVEEEKALQKFQWLGQNIKLEQIPLKAHVGRTFNTEPEPESQDQCGSTDSLSERRREGLNPKDVDFLKSKWFFDTPGVVHQDQIVNLLTTPELLLAVPQKMLLPRNFHLKPGHSIFIAGVGRLDFISGPDFVWFTVFASMELPLTVTKTEDADFVYKKLLGTPFFRVPMKGKQRLEKWPGLSSKQIEISGQIDRYRIKNKQVGPNNLEASADVVLSSAGWVAVAVPVGYRCQLEAWTPEGKGIHVRDYPIIKRGFTFKGERIRGTPAFKTVMKEVKGYSLTDEPPLEF